MPISPSRLQCDSWAPSQPWADDCVVQWGRAGIVLRGKSNDTYRTAFFEAFPKDGSAGFLRGEGGDLDAAEAQAFGLWSTFNACMRDGGHRWTRTRRLPEGKTTTYLNGGTFCLRCGSFATTMKPVVILGDWRKPLSHSDLSALAAGFVRPSQFDEDRPWSKRLYLRARRAGIVLPQEPEENDDHLAFMIIHEEACQRAIRSFVWQNTDRLRAEVSSGIVGLFDRVALRYLLDIAESDDKEEQHV